MKFTRYTVPKNLYNIKSNIICTRNLSTSPVLSKTKDSNKQALRNLGTSLQNGMVKGDNENPEPNDQPDDSDEHKQNYKILQNYYDSISHMTTEDLLIQQNLDEGKQFNSFPSEHFLDRKSLIRNLPDEIDIFNTPISKIEKIYKDLGKLDKDRSVHLKYYKRYLRNYSDPIIRILQEFNGINDKFKMLRRGEADKLYLNPNSSLFKDNLFHLPYNVVGFDRSVSGFPLSSSTSKDISYPLEFIQDLQQCDPKIKLHKKDLDFVEYTENSQTINPDELIKPTIDNVINMINDEIEKPRNFVVLDDVNQYKVLKFGFLNKFNSMLETEINSIKSSLQKEIELILSADNKSPNLLLFNHLFFKKNSFKLCDLLKDKQLPNSKILILSYNVKEMNLIPYNYLCNNSVRSHKRLYNHIFKLFLINLKDQIETLLRLKYFNRKQVFVNNLNTKISNIITFKLINLFHRANRLGNIEESVIFKPYENKSYKRLYNYKRNSTKRFNMVDLEHQL